MELKEGMYVRFKDKKGNTYIRKVIDGYKEHWYGCKVDKNANNVPYVSEKNIINVSYSIIDLIEVGDYVNGEKVVYITNEEDCWYLEGNKSELDLIAGRDIDGFGKPIKSIVTKEQFESMEYEVE